MPISLPFIKEKLFENIFNNASNGIAIVGLDFSWVKVNTSLMDLLGYSEEEFYAMTFPDITHKDDLDADMEQLGQLLKGEIDRYQIEKRYFHKKGEIIWALLSVSLQLQEDGTPLYFISQIVDITKRKEMLWEMNAITEIMKNQNEKLIDFANIATHDIRSHIGNLGLITGFMEEEVEGIQDDGNFKMLKEALIQLENTLSHLNEVRKEEFNGRGHLKALNLNAFVVKVIYNINAIARHEDCEIINEVDGTIQVLAVPIYLESVILNLLTNAIKYSATKRNSYIRLRTIISDDFVILEVIDNGLGIDLDKHRHNIFQLKQTFHHHKDSRGVGLFITKNHVETMGGKIEVESQVDVGSTFSVFLQEA
jgi:PAS domain S-box-containing protein